MASPLFIFLSELAADPAKLAAFRTNPDGVMDEYKLTEEQKTLLKSNNEYDYIKTVTEEAISQFGSSEQRRCI